MDPGFSIPRLSLLDAASSMPLPMSVAAVSSGETWYEQGKTLTKKKHLHRLHRLR
jgi:protease II